MSCNFVKFYKNKILFYDEIKIVIECKKNHRGYVKCYKSVVNDLDYWLRLIPVEKLPTSSFKW